MNFTNQLQDIISELYAVFDKYTIDAAELRAYSCECCVSDAEIREITTTPLRVLTEDSLDNFSRSAITTFGDVEHYKYYLPRILELMADEQSAFADEFTCFEKLNYGAWHTWPPEEQQILNTYFRILWKETINNPEIEEHRLNSIFGIMIAYGYIKQALADWEQSETLVSTMYLVDGILRNFSFEGHAAAKDRFLVWLKSPAVLKKLETLFYDTKDVMQANEISIAYTILENKGTVFIR